MKKGIKLKPLIAAAILIGGLSSQVVAEVKFSHYPVIGHIKLPPNVLLMLSVEFPTAKGVYQTDEFTFANIKQTTYNGYFDPNLCYTYVYANSNSTGTNEAGYFNPTSKATSEHLCSGTKDEYSGNLLNAVSTTTLDIFRKTLSGGNRARGNGTASANYTNGDTATETFLRRAMVQVGKNQLNNLIGRNVRGTAAEMRKITPFSAAWLTFRNGAVNGYGHPFSIFVASSGQDTPIARGSLRHVYNASVKVCGDDPNLREDNCVLYPNGKYKPEGLMQEYKTQMRFGVFGYLNTISNNDGGIMRARLKSLSEDGTVSSAHTTSNYVLGKEIDENTGQFFVNPDIKDATNSGVTNSGVINYLNKFGDASGYKTFDVLGRLYYSGLRYLKGLPNPSVYTSAVTSTNKDNFPVITDWDDPLKRDSLQGCNRNNVMIVIGDTNDHEGSGTNRIPGYAGSPFTDDKDVNGTTINYLQYANAVRAKEGVTATDSITNGMALIGPCLLCADKGYSYRS